MDRFSKYNRQILLPGFGKEQQQKLFDAKVLVIGAGGLGCPALLYLAAAGVGKLGIVDYDTVDISNLHRQVLYNEKDINKPKAIVAAEKIKQDYPDTEIEIFNCQITNKNALSIISEFDLVIDGSDNFSTRYLVNDACVLLNKPLVYGAVYCYEGQVGVFNLAADDKIKTSYRDLFPIPPEANEIPNCSEAGVLGVLPGIMGTMQANEAIKIITGIGEPLVNKVLTYHSLSNSFYEIEVIKNEEAFAIAPKNEVEFMNRDYELTCKSNNVKEIKPAQLMQMMDAAEGLPVILDVRNEDELPKLIEYPFFSIPLTELKIRLAEIENSNKIIVVCQSGIRSLNAASIIQNKFKTKEIYSLAGGINEYQKLIKSGSYE